MATTRTRIVVDDSALAKRIGSRLRDARLRAGMTQQQLARGRYTKAYVSALENGISKPSMAALNFFAGRLGVPASHFLGDQAATWERLSADLALASGRWAEAIDAYATLLEATTDPLREAELLRGQAEALCRIDRGAEAIAAASKAADAFASRGRPADAALSRYWLASALFQHENHREARSILRSLLDEVRAGLDMGSEFTVRLLVALGAVEGADGEDRAALAYLEEARGLAEDLDDRRRATYLFSLALGYLGSGDLEAAIRSGLQSLALFQAADAEVEVASLENDLALAYLANGNTERAAELAAAARAEFERLGDGRKLAHATETQARIALARSDASGAVALAEDAVAAARACGSVRAEVAALATRAVALSAGGRADDALSAYREAADRARAGGTRTQQREVLAAWAKALAAAGKHAEAYELTRQALEIEHPQ